MSFGFYGYFIDNLPLLVVKFSDIWSRFAPFAPATKAQNDD
jgi:hypothetical protein